MSKYAVIQLQGKQIKVAEKDVFEVDRVEVAEGETFSVNEVLLVADGDKISVGTPVVAKAVVKLKVLSNLKDTKIDVFKYKSKSRYRRSRGHRQLISRLEVMAIS